MSRAVRNDDDVQRLLLDVGWLRSLARRLAGDAHLADDLVQEVCTIALRRQTPPEQWRAWLTGVLKTLVRADRRERVRRQRRALRLACEASRAASEDLTVLVQRAEMHRLLVDALLELEEPYRGTLLLRFFESMPPRRIAMRQGVPVATVHSRLQRGLAQLRVRLDREAGGRQQWMALLVPFAWPDGVSTTALAGRTVRVALAATVAVAMVTLFATADHDEGPLGRTTDSVGGAVDTTESVVAVVTTERSPGEGGSSRVEPRFTVRGRFCDIEGRGVAGVPVTAVLGDSVEAAKRKRRTFTAFATTGADGRFAGELPEPAAFVLTTAPEWEMVLMGIWEHGRGVEPVVVVAPPVVVDGCVVDGMGLPVSHGFVNLVVPPGSFARLPSGLEASGSMAHGVAVGADSSFQARLPFLAGASLRITAVGCAPAQIRLEPTDVHGLRIELAALATSPGDLCGCVIGPDGSRAFGATVVADRATTIADRDGRFTLRTPNPQAAVVVVAALPGRLPARVELAPGDPRARDLVLQLGEPCGTVEGRVVDEAGPVAGAMVWLDDPTPLGRSLVDGRLLQLEFLLGGAPLISRSWNGFEVQQVGAAAPTYDSESLAHEDQPTASWQFVCTDAAGRFRVPGLLPRAYRLRAFHGASGRMATCEGAVAGGSPELVLPPRSAARALRGRIVGRDGAGIRDADVRLKFELWKTSTRFDRASHTFVVLSDGAVARTAADGSFTLPDVTATGSFVMVLGGEAIPTRIAVMAFETGPVVVSRRCPLSVRLADPNEADAATFVDAAGKSEMVGAEVLGNTHEFVRTVALHRGLSGPLLVGDSAVACVLLRDGRRSRIVPIAPAPDRDTVVQ